MRSGLEKYYEEITALSLDILTAYRHLYVSATGYRSTRSVDGGEHGLKMNDVRGTLLRPESVAVIGASRTPGKVGYVVLNNLVEGDFQGEIIPVNPNAETILELKCYPDLKSYGKPLDISFICLPAEKVRDAVRDSIDSNTKLIIVLSAGFKEVGEEGAELEKEITRMCASAGVRLLGPNSLGLINTEHALSASFARKMPQTGGISIFSQSGALCSAILDWAAGRHLGLAKFVSLGNKADLNEVDFLEVFAADEQTKAICGYLETIQSGDEFVKAAEAAASIKPVVILKVGTTEAGERAATVHTGELSGREIGLGAAFKRAGVTKADTFQSLLDYATAFGLQPLPEGDRVLIITNAGGPGIMAADAVENSGMNIAALGGKTLDSLSEKLPPAVHLSNPIDLLGDASPERYVAAVTAAMEDDSVDAVIVILAPQAQTQPAETAKAIAGCLNGEKTILAVFMGGVEVKLGREALASSNLPDFPSPERAVDALKAMVDYAAWRRRPPRVVTRFPVNRRRVERAINRHNKRGHAEITEVYAKDILRAYDFVVPDGGITTDAEEAVELAERIGYPVAMKIASFDIIHKSDVGGVKLNVTDPESVRDTFELMMLRVHRRAPEARIDGVYVEQMCSPGLEVIIGMRSDPEFGPMLMFGLGGIFVETMQDITFYLAPITEDEAMQMLLSTRSYSLLMGRKGQHDVDLHAIASGLQRISQLVTDFPQIAELDINPLVIGKIGTPPVVVDARMILSEVHKKDG